VKLICSRYRSHNLHDNLVGQGRVHTRSTIFRKRRRLVFPEPDDDDDDDDDDDGDADSGRRDAPGDSSRNEEQTAQRSTQAAHTGTATQKKQARCPPPAKRSCPRGHGLSAVNSKPADYRKLEGNVGNCDLCDVDFKYTAGGYHCDSCKNWDCCVACGGKAAPEATKSLRNKKQQSKKF